MVHTRPIYHMYSAELCLVCLWICFERPQGKIGENRPIKRKHQKNGTKKHRSRKASSSISRSKGCLADVGYLAAKEMVNWIKFKFTVKIFSLYLCHLFFAVCFLLCICARNRLRRFFRLQFSFEYFRDFIRVSPLKLRERTFAGVFYRYCPKKMIVYKKDL